MGWAVKTRFLDYVRRSAEVLNTTRKHTSECSCEYCNPLEVGLCQLVPEEGTGKPNFRPVILDVQCVPRTGLRFEESRWALWIKALKPVRGAPADRGMEGPTGDGCT